MFASPERAAISHGNGPAHTAPELVSSSPALHVPLLKCEQCINKSINCIKMHLILSLFFAGIMKSAFERAGGVLLSAMGWVGGWGDFPVCDVRFINSAII